MDLGCLRFVGRGKGWWEFLWACFTQGFGYLIWRYIVPVSGFFFFTWAKAFLPTCWWLFLLFLVIHMVVVLGPKGHRVKKWLFPDRIKPKRTSKSKMTCPGNSGGSSKVTAWITKWPTCPIFFWVRDSGSRIWWNIPPKKKQKKNASEKNAQKKWFRKKTPYKIIGSPKNLSFWILAELCWVWHPNTPFWQVTMPVTTIVALWTVSQRMLSL